MNQVQKDLLAAKEVIKDPKNWTQGGRAKNANGEIVHVKHPSAVCFCAVGAVEKVLDDRVVDDVDGIYSNLNPTVKCLNDVVKEKGYEYRTIWGFNDSSIFFVSGEEGHKQVLEVFDKAIELAGTRDYEGNHE